MFLSFHALFGEIITKSLPDKIHETQVGAQVVGVKHDKETQASGGGIGATAAVKQGNAGGGGCGGAGGGV